MQLRYSFYPRFTSNQPAMKSASDWSEFVMQMAELAEPRLANDRTKRSSTPAISPAVYAPGSIRCDETVLEWGGWIALDVDNASDVLIPVMLETARDLLDDLGVNYLIYASTKSTVQRPRYRVVLPTSRAVSINEYRDVWNAVVQMFDVLGPDPSCKDASRIYGGPSIWLPADDGNQEPFNIFEFDIDGALLDVDLVLAKYVPPIEEERPPVSVPTFAKKTVETMEKTKFLKPGTTLADSPVVSGDAVQAYLNLGKGDHHNGMFRFICSVLARAKARGYDLTDEDVTAYCRELDVLSPISTSKDRWSRIRYEITRARRFIG